MTKDTYSTHVSRCYIEQYFQVLCNFILAWKRAKIFVFSKATAEGTLNDKFVVKDGPWGDVCTPTALHLHRVQVLQKFLSSIAWESKMKI